MMHRCCCPRCRCHHYRCSPAGSRRGRPSGQTAWRAAGAWRGKSARSAGRGERRCGPSRTLHAPVDVGGRTGRGRVPRENWAADQRRPDCGGLETQCQAQPAARWTHTGYAHSWVPPQPRQALRGTCHSAHCNASREKQYPVQPAGPHLADPAAQVLWVAHSGAHGQQLDVGRQVDDHLEGGKRGITRVSLVKVSGSKAAGFSARQQAQKAEPHR